MYVYRSSRGSGAPSWVLQRITGILLFVVVIAHYFIMHSDPASGHTYAAVLARMHNPFWKMFDLTFITVGLWHGLNGTWGIFRDYDMKPWLSLTIYGIIILSGIAFWVLGINTILSF
jgi:succinate dehydrogenase / fumarate reductase membrane anchor subunit